MRNLTSIVRSSGITAVALCVPALLLLTAGLSWPALTGPFLFDDFPNLEHLRALNGHLDWASLAHYASLFEGEPGRPLSMLAFVINDSDWPSSPWGFKYTNLMLHMLVGIVVFGFTRSLLRTSTTTTVHADGVALLAMAAWLLHPMQLSTSMLVVQRMTQLSALWSLVGLWSYVALVQHATRTLAAILAIAFLGIGTVLAVLSKETGALTPLLALVLNATLLDRNLRLLPGRSRTILHIGVLAPVIVLFAAIVYRLDVLTAYGNRPFDMTERLLSQSRALCEYLFNILVPSLRGGGIYHDDFEISRSLLSPWTTLPAVACVLGLIACAACMHRRWPLFSFAILWFFGGHLLESTIFPLELYFEHRNYLPMVGIFVALATWIIQARARGRKSALAAAIAWLLFAAWLTSVQAPIWGNKSALVAVWATERPGSPRAIQNLAAVQYERGHERQAADTLLKAYGRGVRGVDFPAQVLLLACLNDDIEMAQQAEPLIPETLASGEYARALAVTMRKMRAEVEANSCPGIIPAERWLEMTKALLSNPSYSKGKPAAYLHTERAYYFRSRRELDPTMHELESAWANSKTPQMGRLVAATLASAGLYDDALEWAHRALAHSPKGVRGWFAQDEFSTRQLISALEHMRDGTSGLVPADPIVSPSH